MQQARINPTAPPSTQRKPQRRSGLWLLLAVLVGGASLLMFACIAVTLGVAVIYSQGVLPGVSAAGIDLGSLSQVEAAAAIQSEWRMVNLRDGERFWNLERAALGIEVDAAATAERAYQQGRGESSIFEAFGGIEIAPVVSVDREMLTAALRAFANRVESQPVDAGVTFANGQIQPTPPQNGRLLDVEATVNSVTDLTAGTINLVMVAVSPQITDSSAMIAAASALVGSPLTIRIHDPITGDKINWELPPQTWMDWLTAVPGRDTGITLSLKPEPVRDFLDVQSGIFDETRYLDLDEAVGQIEAAIRSNNTRPTLRVYHRDRQHVVQPGDTIISIGWDYGVPYPWIEQANPGVSTLTVGQTIIIPSPDNFLEFPVIHDKRIVVDMSAQRTRVYENEQLIWDWPASTGINDSPTWPGVYQIISHVPNAYASRWNLYMPQFMGVYRPIPGADFTNGFHGFPTRGGGQILWENSLGRRVTYGCILLSNINAQTLYDWAEEGVVVEIIR